MSTIISTILFIFAAAVAVYFFKAHQKLKSQIKKTSQEAQELAEKLKKSSEIQNEEQKQLSAILESMNEGVLAVDKDQKILLINSTLARSFSFKKNEAIGRYFWEMFRDPEINEMIQAALNNRLSVRREQEALLLDTVFEIQVSPVVHQEEFLGLVVVFRDITSLREFERLRSEFVANVSHELKTPLTSIMGFVETLKEGADQDPANRSKFLQIIENQSKQLHGLIENLLHLSRLESAKEPLRKEKIKVADLFAKLQTIFEPILKDNKIELKVETPAGLQVQAEASTLQRALTNLIDNAIKYNKPGGNIHLRAKEQAGDICFEVEDTGIGIANADLGRIFERFYRVDKSRSREHGGTGLGLAIVKHIMERHQGALDVESFLNHGSKFSLIFPR